MNLQSDAKIIMIDYIHFIPMFLGCIYIIYLCLYIYICPPACRTFMSHSISISQEETCAIQLFSNAY